MSFDLYIAPPSGFLEWNDEQWEQYLGSDPPPEDFRLGRSTYVGFVLEAITHNLEEDKVGSRYPLFMRISHEEQIGWYRHEVASLLGEIEDAKKRLTALPITRSTLSYDDDTDVLARMSDFRECYPDRPLTNLYDLNFYFIDGFQTFAKKALETGRGLVVFY